MPIAVFNDAAHFDVWKRKGLGPIAGGTHLHDGLVEYFAVEIDNAAVRPDGSRTNGFDAFGLLEIPNFYVRVIPPFLGEYLDAFVDGLGWVVVVAIYFPNLCYTGPRPTQRNANRVNTMPIEAMAYTGPDSTSQLSQSAMRIGLS